MCLSSWRNSAYATSEAVRRSFRRYRASADQSERAYRGWDIITSVVEMTEIVATAILNARDPTRFAVHQGSNKQIEALFTTLRDDGIWQQAEEEERKPTGAEVGRDTCAGDQTTRRTSRREADPAGAVQRAPLLCRSCLSRCMDQVGR